VLLQVSRLLQDNTHRLIPSAYDEETVLNRLATDSDELIALSELEGATNERLLGEAGLLPGITIRDLVFGVSYSHVVNAAFTHTNPLGNRFNGPERGAWYAAFSLETAGVGVAFHKAEGLREINWQEKESFLCADFREEFHDIREDFGSAKYLDPTSYAASQKLAGELTD